MSRLYGRMIALVIGATFAASCAAVPTGEAQQTIASPPDLRTPPPVIYLADNLEEPKQLGWCIDTVGRGESDHLHAHSCKPGTGDDVRFSYDRASGLIRSVPYNSQCAEYSDPENETVPFGLVDCDAENPAQQFDYAPESMEIRYRNAPNLCMTVAAIAQQAGPFVSRALKMETCNGVENKYKQWQILTD